ncbi:MAG: DMT family transporter [Flavobacteriales bacterium]|nr:DMT family transporter [Flavobacteriales bacterium]MBL6873610.1 DMT family transporter [Flavobacteriales bacterium]
MHFIVILLGFTGVLGKLIDCGSTVLVWYRMLIAFVFLLAYIYFTSNFKISKNNFIQILGIGFVVAAHWLFFFESIKVSNVSVAVVCMGTSSLFSSFLEPLILKRKIQFRELILSIVVLFAIGLALNADFSYVLGFVYGVIAAFLATLFTILNALYVNKVSSEKITLIEMLGGFLIISVYLLFSNNIAFSDLNISSKDILYLIILGGICTSFAFVISVEVMKFLSPYNVIMAVNLEPVYSVLLALLIFGESENMNLSFYIGGLLIITTVSVDAYLKKNSKQKK